MNKTNAFAQRLKSRRKELRMTLEDVGNALDVSRVAVSSPAALFKNSHRKEEENACKRNIVKQCRIVKYAG